MLCTHQVLVHLPFPGHTGKLHLQNPTYVTEFWNVSRRDKSCFCAKAVKYLWTLHTLFFFFTPDIRSHLLDDPVERWKQPETWITVWTFSTYKSSSSCIGLWQEWEINFINEVINIMGLLQKLSPMIVIGLVILIEQDKPGEIGTKRSVRSLGLMSNHGNQVKIWLFAKCDSELKGRSEIRNRSGIVMS